MQGLTVRANAKINLSLNIKYKRSDGYHEIESVIQEISLHDIITLSPSDHIEIFCDDPVLSSETNNLCVTAAELLVEHFGISGLHISLQKQIPIGAGLGGGSSDAAAVLKGALSLYGINTSRDKLVELAGRIGSDVPFFIYGNSVLARGRGEQLDPVRLCTDYRILLVLPSIHISTSWAYKNLRKGLTPQFADNKFSSSDFQNLKISDFRSVFFNSFENLIFGTYPELERVKKALYQTDAVYAALSGSGSSIFGIYDLTTDLEAVRNKLGKRFTSRIVYPVA